MEVHDDPRDRHHTSGIPDIQKLPDFSPKLAKPTTTQEIIQRFIVLPLDFPPGTSWKYTNSGFILAGAIIETGHEKPYGAICATRSPAR